MKNSLRSIRSLLAAVSVLFLAGLAKANGPVSPLYITLDSPQIFVVQGPSVINSWATRTLGEHPLAVSQTVRTINGGTNFASGSEYTLSGTFTGTTYPYPFGINFFTDGTTDTVSNYTAAINGDVYATDANWANPRFLFTGSRSLGITYDPTDNTLWVADFADSRIEHRSLFGTLLSEFPLPFVPAGLALDPADQTLWMSRIDTAGSFYQYSKSGTQLSSVFYSALTDVVRGAEFQMTTPTTVMEVNGEGTIISSNSGKNFAISDVEDEQVTPIYKEGLLAYQDKKAKFGFETGRIINVTASGNEATISGTAIIKKKVVNFTIQVVGNQNPTTDDTFSISLSNGYSASGNVAKGCITVLPSY